MGITSSISSNAPETTKASGVGFSFGTSSTNKPGFSFGGSSNPTTTTNSAFTGFGQSTTPVQSTGIFSSVAPTTTSTPSFSFNSNVINTSNTTSSPFTGFSAVNPTVAKTEAPSMFTGFGQKPQTAPVTTNSTFGFGNTMNTATTALTAQSTQNNAFSFGQSSVATSNINNENKSTGIFARLGDKQAENKPFAFGGNNQPQNSTFGTVNSPLGSATNVPSIFGSPSSGVSSTTNSVFGQTPVLGSNNNAGNLFSSNNQAIGSPFGSATLQNNNQAQSGGNLFGFGGPSSAPVSNNNNSNNQVSPGMFNFGGSNSNNNNNSNVNQVNPLPSNNIFGGASNASNNNNSGQNVSASFTFNTATRNVSNSQQSAPVTSPFGQQSSAPPPYQFGTPAIGNNVSTSFSFTGSASAPVQNAPASQSGSQMFNFGSSGTGAVPGSFNFQGQQTTLPPQPSPAGGLFNIGTGGNQQRRPARVATRRYK